MPLLLMNRSKRVAMCSILHLNGVQDRCQSARLHFGGDGAEYFANNTSSTTCRHSDTLPFDRPSASSRASYKGWKSVFASLLMRECVHKVDGPRERLEHPHSRIPLIRDHFESGDVLRISHVLSNL